MPAFSYLALDAEGRNQRGVLQADTPRAARSALRERGLNPLEVLAVAERNEGGWSWRRRMPASQLAAFSRQLAVLVGSGLPIDEALSALADASEGPVQGMVLALRSRVMEGATLANALGEQGNLFPALFRASVAAGEAAGRLDQVLKRLADHAEASASLRQRVLLALTYPALLSLVATVVVTALLIYVVPQVTQVFLQQGQVLPWATRVLIALSDFAAHYGGWLLLLLMLGAAGFVVAWRREPTRLAMQQRMLRFPVLGPLLRAADASRFARTLSLLTASAVPLLEALSIAAQVLQLLPLREALGKVAHKVREGHSFGRALADSRQFPVIAVRLIQSGEKSGRLDEMLAEAAAQQERDLDTALGVATAALGPLVILLVGGLVLFIVLAILLPIFQMNTLIK